MRVNSPLLLLASLLLVSTAVAGQVYRSVDEAGNVTFTDTPPEDGQAVERVELPSGPSAERLRESERRNQEIRKAAEQAERERLRERQQQQARIKAAKEQLAKAQARLAEAKVIKDEDRQNLAGGKRRIHPDYFVRVKQAEAEVEAARKALREARGY